MKIAINLLPFRETIAGAGKYAQNIIHELSKIDSLNEYFLYVSEKGKNNFEITTKNFNIIIAKFNPESVIIRIFWEQFIFPFKLRKLKPDIVFTPSVAIPFLYKGRFFTTIHDLGYKSKTKYSFLRKTYIKLITIIASKKSSIIFTVSNFSKAEIERELKIKNKEVLVTYNGVDEIYFRDYTPDEKSDFKKKYKLPDNYVLYVGAIEPGKNLDKLFIAFSKFSKKSDLDLFLVLTSGIGWKKEFLIDMLKELGIKDKIIFLPYIPEIELPLLYKCSKMLIYLSSYEGFGIPVLEALAAGTTVITSRSEAIIEFAGQSVIPVEPNNIDEIVSSIFKVIDNKDYILSKVEEGKKIAQKFRWANSAKIIYNQMELKLPNK